MAREYIELDELLGMVRETVREAFPRKIWVRGEIREWSPRQNGHCYLSLCRTERGKVTAETRAMIWKWNLPAIRSLFESSTGEKLRAGITVLVRAEVNFSELYGLSLFIDDIDPSFTLGEKALQRRLTIERLTSEGYMDMQKELALPPLPRRLAVISSASAAGYGDFRRHLLENEEGYAFTLDLFEALMQGEQAPRSIREAVGEVAERGDYDALLILRGGGSESDLSCFDDFDLAVAIATCPVPVVTAIGHDRDYHVADMVAMSYVKTPTALADMFLECFRSEDDRIFTAASCIRTSLQRRLSTASEALQGAIGAIRIGLSRRVGAMESAIALKEALIKASDPRNILSMGYVLVTGKDNKVLKSVGRVGVGDRIGVRFSDGSVTASVDAVHAQAPDNDKVNIA